jgi:Xylose isomerase-like TIM barrel
VVTHPPRKTRFRLLVRLYRTGLVTRRVPSERFQASDYPPFPSFLGARCVAFEPEVNNVVDSARKARRFLDEIGSPFLKVTIDPANLFHAGEMPRMKEILDEAFALVGKDVVLAHAKDLDHDGNAGHKAAGQGKLVIESARERKSRTHHFIVTTPSRFVQHGSRSSEWLEIAAIGTAPRT